jgi:hypothetical protein
MVYDHHRLFRERVTKRIKTGYHPASVYGVFKPKRMQIVMAIHNPEHIDPPIFPGRKRDDALGLWPGLGNRGIKCKAGFIKIIQRDLALVFLCLQRFQFPFGLGKGVRISEAFERFSHPLPSKTGLFGQAFQRRQTEALVGFVGEALHHPLERMGRFFDILQGDGLFRRAEGARSAAARFIMQTLGAMLFPVLEPGRHGDAMDLIGPGDVLDRRALGTP